MTKEPTFEDLLEAAKKKVEVDHGTEEQTAGGPSIRHRNKIVSLLEEDDSEDLVMHLDNITHEHYSISRVERYACITGTEVTYHYFFNEDYSEFELIPQ
jgi:hypothetical protein